MSGGFDKVIQMFVELAPARVVEATGGAILTTPLQVASLMATVANDGKLVQPTLIRGVRNGSGGSAGFGARISPASRAAISSPIGENVAPSTLVLNRRRAPCRTATRR